MAITKYEFEMLSDPKCLSFHHDDWEDGDKLGVPIQQYRKILFSDSLFNFFPYCEVYFKDTAGQIIDNLFFIEGLQFNCKLGFIKNEEDKTELDKNNKSYVDYLEHSYIWSENEINNINMASSISGDNIFLMISKFFYNDTPKSKTFNHENSSKKYTISNLLKEIILPQWGIPSNKYQNTISDTDGTPYVIQNNTTNQKFISKLAEYSYSKNFIASGFYTFINCNGEFYFMTINELMNQNPVHEFEIDLTDKMFINKNYIKDYRVRFGGVPINYDNYNRKIYTYQSTGNILAEERNIHESIKNFDNDAYLLIRNTYIPKGGVDKINSKVIYGGIQQEENNLEYYKGYKNYFYNDTALSYRMSIVIDFDPNCVSGKTVTIKVLKQSKDNEIAKEFSGTWLICESSHIMGKEGIPYTQLTLAKPKIKLDSDHPFIGDFKA